jgi:hypothetical protein
MNNTFSLNRFVLLFKKHTLEHAKTYLLSIAVLAGVIALMLSFLAYMDDGVLGESAQGLIFIYCIAFAGSIFTSLSFTDLGNKRKATQALTLPASHFEKYLVAWIYTFIIFQLVCVGLFYLVDWTVLSVITPHPPFKNTLVNILDTNQKAYLGFIAFAVFHGLAIWGAIFFEKLHFIKTAFVFFIYIIFFGIIGEPLLHLITGKDYFHGAPFGPLYFPENKQVLHIRPDDNMNYTTLVVLGIAIVIFWISAFFRLKEKEI